MQYNCLSARSLSQIPNSPPLRKTLAVGISPVHPLPMLSPVWIQASNTLDESMAVWYVFLPSSSRTTSFRIHSILLQCSSGYTAAAIPSQSTPPFSEPEEKILQRPMQALSRFCTCTDTCLGPLNSFGANTLTCTDSPFISSINIPTSLAPFVVFSTSS